MRTLILPLLSILSFTSCKQEIKKTKGLEETASVSANMLSPIIKICHYNVVNNTFETITINLTAWPEHQYHGDIRLDDQDDDGYVPYNACGIGQQGDCNDNDATIHPGATELCGNSIDENCNGMRDDVYSSIYSDLIGYWSGSVSQQGYGTYTISLTVGCNAVNVRYPSLGCSGYWELIEVNSGVYHFREVITSGLNCASPCGHNISVDKDGSLNYETVASECFGVVVHGSLKKRM